MLISICLFLLLTNLGFGQTDTVSSKAFSLDQCIELALKNNATVIAARNSYNVAKSDVWTGWGVLIPSLGSRIGYSRTVQGPTQRTSFDQTTGNLIFGMGGVQTSKSYSASMSASQSWSLGGYNLFQIKEKNASKNSAFNSYQLTRQELVLSVKQAYFDVLKAKMLLEIQQQTMKRAKTTQDCPNPIRSGIGIVLGCTQSEGPIWRRKVSADQRRKQCKADQSYLE